MEKEKDIKEVIKKRPYTKGLFFKTKTNFLYIATFFL